jgi:pyruvate dehydrogenase E2 component (dihydrolipoamide acetyltransferase)
LVARVLMPKLSLTMEMGSVVQWFKKEGERVEKGEPVVEVLSEKVTYDVEAPASGFLKKILAEEGVDLPVGATLAFIGTSDEELPDLEAEVPMAERDVVAVAGKVEATAVRERLLASPAAKRLAKERGVNLAQVQGTGPQGRIVEEDVRDFVERPAAPTPKIKEEFPLSGVRRTTAERVATSFQTAPHSYIVMEVDMTKAAVLRERVQASYTALLVHAASKALREHPTVNSTLVNGQVRVYEDINVGVAVSTKEGLVVPIIRDVEKRRPEQISLELEELAKKARGGELTREQLTGGTFTVTNLGMYGVDMFLPIINPPEAAILAAGRIVTKPVAVEGEIAARPVMKLTLAYDHRILDGAPAATFLEKIRRILESID